MYTVNQVWSCWILRIEDLPYLSRELYKKRRNGPIQRKKVRRARLKAKCSKRSRIAMAKDDSKVWLFHYNLQNILSNIISKTWNQEVPVPYLSYVATINLLSPNKEPWIDESKTKSSWENRYTPTTTSSILMLTSIATWPPKTSFGTKIIISNVLSIRRRKRIAH